MKFEKTEVWGFEHALRGMRNPMNSWYKSNTKIVLVNKNDTWQEEARIGENDMKLAQSLIKAGSEHRKFMRQIFVSVDITAPLYWWKEFDTYKVGTVANSTSTMHKLASTPITKECFEMDDFDKLPRLECKYVKVSIGAYWEFYLIPVLENLRQKYNETKDKRYWKELIRLLPEKLVTEKNCHNELRKHSEYGTSEEGSQADRMVKVIHGWAESLPYAKEFLFYKGE